MPPLPVRYAAHVSLLCRILCCFKVEAVKVAPSQSCQFCVHAVGSQIERSPCNGQKPSQEGTLKHGSGQHTGQ